MSEFISEFIGTFLLVLLGNGVVGNVVLSNTKGHNSGWIVITFGWGMAVFIAVLTAGQFSGAHINPAVTVGLAVAGTFPWVKVPLFILAQMLGGALGAFFVWLFYRQHYTVTEDPGAKLATFATAPQIRSNTHNLISEAIGTFVLVFVVLYMAGPEISAVGLSEPKIGLGALGALPVGLLVFSIGLSLGGTTGYAINPARDLSPRFMHALLPIPGKGSSDWSYAWIPVIGPIVGATIAGLLYLIIQ
jgi:glycerol uptake facilitator protein